MWWLALLTQPMRCWQTSGISLTAESWQPILLHGVAKPNSGPPHLGWTMYMETSTWCPGYQRLHPHSLLQLESKSLGVLANRVCACNFFYDSSPVLMVVAQLTVYSCARRSSHTKFWCTFYVVDDNSSCAPSASTAHDITYSTSDCAHMSALAILASLFLCIRLHVQAHYVCDFDFLWEVCNTHDWDTPSDVK